MSSSLTTSVLCGGSGSRSSTPASLRAQARRATMAAATIAPNSQRSAVDCIIVVVTYSGSRSSGQVMQWPPPRPLPSSKPSISITSTPAWRILAIV